MKKRESPTEKWDRLTNLARQGSHPEPREEEVPLPPGLATRVAAHWSTEFERPTLLTSLERALWWGGGLSASLCLAGLLFLESSSEANAPDTYAFDSFFFAPQPPEGGPPLMF